MKHHYSIQRRILLGSSLALVAITVLLFIMGRWYAQRAADEAFDRVLGAAALSIADTISLQDGQLNVDLPHSAFSILGTSRLNRIFYRVVSPDGSLLTGSPILGLEIPHGASGQLRLFDSVYRGEAVRIAAVARFHSDAKSGGWVDVLVGETREAREQLTMQLSLNAILPASGIALLACILILLAIRLAFRPLRTIEADLRRRNSADLAPLSNPIPREVSALALALNDFMSRLDIVLAGLKRVTADAAHQMRTPLTVLRTLTELSLEETDPQRQKEILRRIHANSVNASLLANQLLSEATTLHSLQSRKPERLDMRQTVQDALRRLQTEANYSALVDMIDVAMPQDSLFVFGEAVGLREMVRNLLENALVHAPGPIEVRLKQETDSLIVLSVSDHGPGIPPEIRERVFERFFRADQSKPGSGLGLSIAQMVIEALNGHISIDGRPDGGTRVTVTLRAAPAKERSET